MELQKKLKDGKTQNSSKKLKDLAFGVTKLIAKINRNVKKIGEKQ